MQEGQSARDRISEEERNNLNDTVEMNEPEDEKDDSEGKASSGKSEGLSGDDVS